jgi:hypothetical protein
MPGIKEEKMPPQLAHEKGYPKLVQLLTSVDARTGTASEGVRTARPRRILVIYIKPKGAADSHWS